MSALLGAQATNPSNPMALDKLTQKLQEALQTAQGLASKSSHPELKSGHVLLALLQQEGGIATPILQKAGVNVAQLKVAVAAALAQPMPMPTV